MEVRVTYESLFDLLRRERSRIELQKLDGTFLGDVQAFIQDKQSHSKSGESLADSVQLHNTRKILKELYERRQRKIMALALDKSRIDAAVFDSTALLPNELQLYEEISLLLARHKVAAIGSMIAGADAILPPIGFKRPNQEAVISEKPIVKTPPVNEPLPMDPDVEKAQEAARIRFLSPIPKFLGPQQEIFGPYQKEDEATLPKEVAQLLIKKGRAQLLQA